jgi:hypothetical protein
VSRRQYGSSGARGVFGRAPGTVLLGAFGDDVADRVLDQGAEFGAGDVFERVSGQVPEEPSAETPGKYLLTRLLSHT